MTVIGYNDYCFMLFTERSHRRTWEHFKAGVCQCADILGILGKNVHFKIKKMFLIGTEVGPFDNTNFDNTNCKLHLFLLRDLNPTTYWSVESEGQEKQHSPVFLNLECS